MYFFAIRNCGRRLKATSDESAKGSEASVYRWNMYPMGRIAMAAIAILPIGYMFQRYTDASLPFADSSLVAFSLLPQFLMAKKYIENWYFWILVDVFYVPLYSYKQLYPTAALYLAFIPLCVAGLMEWRKSMAAATVIA